MSRIAPLTLFALGLGLVSRGAFALGLGEIHVESALHQPLTAEIDLIDATATDLAGLHASIADQEMFSRYGLDRPSFLSTITLKVGQDGKGNPILAVHSTEPVSDPVVTFLVALQSPGGQLVREYSVLLDPADLEPATEAAKPTAQAEAPVMPVTAAPTPTLTPAVDSTTVGRLHTVSRHDTHARIARVAGARSSADRRRMKVAISRTSHKAAARVKPETDSSELSQRVELLEKSLKDVRQELQQEQLLANQLASRANAAPVPAPALTSPTLTTEDAPVDDEPVSRPSHAGFMSLAAGLGLALAGAAWWLYRRVSNAENAIARPYTTARAPGAPAKKEERPALSGDVVPFQPTLFDAPPSSASNSTPDLFDSESTARLDAAIDAAAEATAVLPKGVDASAEASNEILESTVRLFKPEDDTAHVVLASALSEPPPFVERRKNPVDVLLKALEREPDRNDLRLKLIELYYTAAAQNRRAFLELTHQQALSAQSLSDEEWARILDMGRIIAPDDELFCPPTNKKHIA